MLCLKEGKTPVTSPLYASFSTQWQLETYMYNGLVAAVAF